MNGSSQFCFHRDHSKMSKRHQEPALVCRELKPKCCFVLTRFQVFEVQGTEFWKPQAALGFGSSYTDSEEQCLEKCECPLCVGTVTVLSACPWRPLGVTKGPRKLTLSRFRLKAWTLRSGLDLEFRPWTWTSDLELRYINNN